MPTTATATTVIEKKSHPNTVPRPPLAHKLPACTEPLDEISEEVQQAPGFAWPPKNPEADNDEHVPTATPLYVPPPETQHIKAPPPPTEVPPLPNRLDATAACQSAPELRSVMSESIQEGHEIESGSESCTSTTNTTSEDYAHMRIYQPGPPGAIYDQGFSDSSEYIEHSAQQEQQHKQSICSTEVSSINESAECRHTASAYLSKSIDTSCLVDTIRATTPRPASPVPLVQTPRPMKRVEFIGVKDEHEECQSGVIIEEVRETQQQQYESCAISESCLSNVTCASQQECSSAAYGMTIPEMKPLPPTHIENAVPHEWESAMVKALKTAPNNTFEMTSSSRNVSYEEAKGSLMSAVLTTCPSSAMDFTEKFPNPNYPVPLPEDTTPYFPPPINMKVTPNTSISGAKSPMLKALITAPDRPYSPFPAEVMYQLDDLPTPKGKMDMQSALTVASDRPYTPMQFDRNGLAVGSGSLSESCTMESYKEQTQMHQQDVSSAFASVAQGPIKPFQPVSTTIDTAQNNSFVCTSSVQSSQSYNQQRVEQSQTFQSSSAASTVALASSSSQFEQQQLKQQEERVQGQWYNETSSIGHHHQQQQQPHENRPIPVHNHHHHAERGNAHPITNPTSSSRFGHLHKPDTIPSYQQNFQMLSSQQPTRPPVSPQLKENVPIAFLESPQPHISFDLPDHFQQSRPNKSSHSQPHNYHSSHPPTKQFTQPHDRKPEVESNPGAYSEGDAASLSTGSKKEYGHQDYTNFTQTSVPVLPRPNGPITMTFQSLDDVDAAAQMQHDEQPPPFHHQPGVGFEYQQQMMQQQQKQVRDEMHQQYSAPRPYTPSVINKPAPIIPHYQKNLTVEECRAANSEIFDPARRSPSPLPMTRCMAQGPPPNPLKALQNNNQQVLESSEFREFQQKDQQNWMGMQGASQTTFLQKPEQVQQGRIGNMNMQSTSNESQMNQNKRMEAQSQSVQQVGNAQVQRRTRVVEEFERSQTAKTVEIRTSSDGTVSSVMTSGGAIHDAPKISGDEIPRGIVANQARRFSQDVTTTESTSSSVASKVQNLNLKSQERKTFFPTDPASTPKDRFPVHNPGDTKRHETMVFPPPGFGPNCNSDLMACRQPILPGNQQQQKQPKPSLQPISYSAKPFSYTASSDLNAITIPSITQFKPMTNSNKTNQSNLNPSPVVYPPTMNPLANQQQQFSAVANNNRSCCEAPALPSLTAPLSFSVAATNGTAAASSSLAMSSSSSSANNTAKQASFKSSSSAAGASVCPPSTNNSNAQNKTNNNNKGGAGITCGPKRGRGVMNKAVAPGGRIPLCGCCNSQIRLARHLRGLPVKSVLLCSRCLILGMPMSVID